jgi:hypothetical protein
MILERMRMESGLPGKQISLDKRFAGSSPVLSAHVLNNYSHKGDNVMGQLIWSESPVKKFVNRKLLDKVVKYNMWEEKESNVPGQIAGNFENVIKTLEEKGIKENE